MSELDLGVLAWSPVFQRERRLVERVLLVVNVADASAFEAHSIAVVRCELWQEVLLGIRVVGVSLVHFVVRHLYLVFRR